MAIAEMKKLTLVGMTSERDALFDALTATGAVHIAPFADVGEPTPAAAREETERRLARVREAIESVSDAARSQKQKLPALERDLPLSGFLAYGARAEALDALCEDILAKKTEIAGLTSENTRLTGILNAVSVYAPFDVRFSDCRSTKHAWIALGIVTDEGARILAQRAAESALVCVTAGASTGQGVPVFVVAHVSEKDIAVSALSEAGFSPCAFSDEATPREKADALRASIEENDRQKLALRAQTAERADALADLAAYADYLSYLLQKCEGAEDSFETKTAFLLQAYVPAGKEQAVMAAVDGVTDARYYAFSDPEPTDEVPTMLENRPVTRQFESIVDMYSPPNYREVDPSFVVMLFFTVFFGFIMADIGYGILLIAGAFGFAATKKRDTGFRRLVYVIGVGGIFTLLFGVLFGSFFGLGHDEWALLPPATLPDPVEDSQTLLIYCLIAGAVHLLVSFLLAGAKALKRGSVSDFLFDGLGWALFFVGLIALMWQLLPGLLGVSLPKLPDSVFYAALGLAGTVLVVEVFAAGRHAKGFGKFTKGFGALYGLINFMSDILSYARLFGLMLSGAIIANIVSTMAIPMMTSVGGAIAGVLILLIGHAFNLAMGVLGAYVHDLRLQYIEFFSRFYEGEGERFRPLGSSLQYTVIRN